MVSLIRTWKFEKHNSSGGCPAIGWGAAVVPFIQVDKFHLTDRDLGLLMEGCFMKTIVKIKLDLCRHNYAALVQAIQNDSETRLVKALLLSDGKPWKIPPGATAAVAYRKPDQTKGLYDKLADGTPALEISGPTVTLALTQQMLTVPGKIQAGIVFFDENLNQLTTFPFTVAVEEDPFSGAQASADYIRLQWLEDQLDEHLRQAKESGEFDGQSVLLLEDRVEYQTASSGQTPPEGDWLSTIPQTPQGSYLWTRRTKLWSGQEPIVDYSVAYQGLDGGIASVNGVEPDETGNVTLTPADVGAAEPEEVQNLFRKASPSNLLDNSDFTNPVAQAGIGGNHGNQVYAIDRWILTNGSVSQQEGGLQLNGTITQKLEHLPTGPVSAFVGMASGQASISYSDGAVTITSSGGVIAWAALYEGTYTEQTRPEYHPKGYAAEFVECQRYYRNYNLTYAASLILPGLVTSSAKIIELFPPDTTPMRTSSPTILFSGTVIIRGVNGYATDHGASGYSGADVAVYQSASTHLSAISITKSDGSAWGLTNNTPVVVQFSGNPVFEYHADL